MSFKLGNSEFFEGKRYFHNLTKEKLRLYFKEIGGMHILELEETPSVETNRDTVWIYCIVRKDNF